MSTLRDSLLPVMSSLRGLPPLFGLRRFGVTIRRRIWSGTSINDGTATNQDIVITPLPRVRQTFSSASLRPEQLQYILANGNTIDDRYFTIDRITPAFVNNGTPGGYSAQQMKLIGNPDQSTVEYLVILVGDDGLKRECVQTTFAEDRAFGYSMMVHETDRPRVALQTIAVTPSTPSIVHGTTQQMTATGTFTDGSTSDLTPLVTWSSANGTIATVDLMGSVTGVAAGTATIQASLTGVSGATTLTVT